MEICTTGRQQMTSNRRAFRSGLFQRVWNDELGCPYCWRISPSRLSPSAFSYQLRESCGKCEVNPMLTWRMGLGSERSRRSACINQECEMQLQSSRIQFSCTWAPSASCSSRFPETMMIQPGLRHLEVSDRELSPIRKPSVVSEAQQPSHNKLSSTPKCSASCTPSEIVTVVQASLCLKSAGCGPVDGLDNCVQRTPKLTH